MQPLFIALHGISRMTKVCVHRRLGFPNVQQQRESEHLQQSKASEVETPIALVEAEQSPGAASKTRNQKMGLRSSIYLSRNAHVVMGANGASGIVLDIVYAAMVSRTLLFPECKCFRFRRLFFASSDTRYFRYGGAAGAFDGKTETARTCRGNPASPSDDDDDNDDDNNNNNNSTSTSVLLVC